MEPELPSIIINADPKVGIGTRTRVERIQVEADDMYLSTPGGGIILRSPDGNTCQRVTIDNAGNLVLTSVACA